CAGTSITSCSLCTRGRRSRKRIHAQPDRNVAPSTFHAANLRSGKQESAHRGSRPSRIVQALTLKIIHTVRDSAVLITVAGDVDSATVESLVTNLEVALKAASDG